MKVLRATSRLFPAQPNRPASKDKEIGVVSSSLKASSRKAENIYTHKHRFGGLFVCFLYFFFIIYCLSFFFFLCLYFFFPSVFLFLFFPRKRLFWIMLKFPILPILGQKSTVCMHQSREISLQIHKLSLEWGLFWTKHLMASVLSVQDMNEVLYSLRGHLSNFTLSHFGPNTSSL